ncbi:D-arabinono-1,4-lactone oxidase [Granulicella arctica]|uniref:D-arabinono-1,4-lactone oxidase n=1 Tax=Granulicella arctica TaxID=940613 RepID=UPI0021DF9BF7|nr:D-arabinono-1,4-lactone oxidase [Granulicella arctica]
MDKRDFLKTTGALVAGSILSRIAPGQAGTSARTNWAGNLTYSTDHLDLPNNVEDVRRAIESHPHLKALGARHSFNNIADSTEDQISLRHFDQIELDAAARTVTVGAGVTYGQLAPYIDSRGFAVHNLASLPHISVVGACATGTHGSGSRNGNLSTAVRAMEIITANGETVIFSREKLGDKFLGTVVGLGALGVITRITLAVEPTFQMTQVVYENLSFAQLEHNLEAIFGSSYSVSLFTDWQKHRATQVWLKRRVDQTASAQLPPDFYGATLATRKMHPIYDHPAENCTDQMGIPGPWYERLPHFKMNFTPSSGAEIQTEYFVPREKGYEAILAVEALRDQITPHLFVTEFRTIAADDLWISPCYQRPSMALHFTWKPEWPAVKKILPLIEAKLEPFQVRPHWAKMFTLAPATLQSRYAKLQAFKKIVAEYDPKGKFRNEFLSKNIYGV